MHDDRALVEGRLARTLRQRLRPAIHPHTTALTIEAWQAPGEPVGVAEGLAAAYSPVRIGDPWGPPWGTTWLKISGRVPREWAGRTVEIVVDLGFDGHNTGFQCEGLAYTPDGSPIKGVNPFNGWVPVAAPASGGEEVLCYLEAASNPVVESHFMPTPLGDLATA